MKLQIAHLSGQVFLWSGFILAILAGAPSVPAKPSKSAKPAKAKTTSDLWLASRFQQPTKKGVHVVDLQSGQLRFLGGWYDWSLSPNGKQVAGGGEKEGGKPTYEVFIAAVSGGKQRHMASIPITGFGGGSFSWSKDNTALDIAGPFGPNDKGEVFRVLLSRPNHLIRLGPVPDWKAQHIVSPNGHYRCATLPNNERILIVKDTRSGKEVRRVDAGRPCTIEEWSPDNNKVLFVKNGSYSGFPEVNDQLCQFDVKTGRISSILSNFKHISEVKFSPNGQWLAFPAGKSSYQKADYMGGIFICRADGSRLTQITKNVVYTKSDADDREVVWLPDGKSLAFRRTFYEDEGI